MAAFWDKSTLDSNKVLADAIRAKLAPDKVLELLASHNALVRGRYDTTTEALNFSGEAAKGLANDVTRLKGENSALQERYDALEKDHDVLNDAVSGLHEDLSGSVRAREQLERDNATLRTQLTEAQAHTQALQAQLEALMESLEPEQPPEEPDPIEEEPVTEPEIPDPDPDPPPIVLPELPRPNGRGYLEVNEGFDLAKLPKAARERYKETLEHADGRYDIYLEPLTRGGHYVFGANGEIKSDKQGNRVFAEYLDKAPDIYKLRELQWWGSPLIELLQLTGAREVYDKLADAGPKIARLFVTKYSWPVSPLAKKLEQQGVMRAIDWKTGGISGDLSRGLDSDLSRAMMATLNFTFWQNEKLNPELSKWYSNFFLEHVMKRSFYLGVMDRGRDEHKALWKSAKCDTLTFRQILDVYRDAGLAFPLEMWGHNLGHAVSGANLTMHLSHLQYGWPEFQESRDRLGKWNQDAHVFLPSTFGELCVMPHNIPGRVKQLGWAGGKGFFDTTYAREKFCHDHLAYLTGHPYVTKRMLAGMARTMHYVVLDGGAQAQKGTCAGTFGGASDDKTLNKKPVVILRGGEVIRSSEKHPIPYLANPQGRTDAGQNTIRRGLNCLFGYLTGDARIKRETALLNDGQPPVKRGNSASLLRWEVERL